MKARIVDNKTFQGRVFRPNPYSPVYLLLDRLPVGGRTVVFDLTYERVLDKSDSVRQDVVL